MQNIRKRSLFSILFPHLKTKPKNSHRSLAQLDRAMTWGSIPGSRFFCCFAFYSSSGNSVHRINQTETTESGCENCHISGEDRTRNYHGANLLQGTVLFRPSKELLFVEFFDVFFRNACLEKYFLTGRNNASEWKWNIEIRRKWGRINNHWIEVWNLGWKWIFDHTTF